MQQMHFASGFITQLTSAIQEMGGQGQSCVPEYGQSSGVGEPF